MGRVRPALDCASGLNPAPQWARGAGDQGPESSWGLENIG